ncbi:hypothetical protein BOO71_0005659 [Deinococcus marmoris]|uniref:Uncharacterized protein n=1 Tax=Deinococcus marmoris TaxID=249408 RepID=A0A1U7P011_9DEIO|nr:hypothetical protein BOO71_0005659 [Deinococcus marmoris]
MKRGKAQKNIPPVVEWKNRRCPDFYRVPNTSRVMFAGKLLWMSTA